MDASRREMEGLGMEKKWNAVNVGWDNAAVVGVAFGLDD